MTVRAFSYGGGVQSTAAMVLAAEGRIDYPLFIFADVGAASENPATVAYVRDVAAPFAWRNGIELVTVQKKLRGGEPDDLLERIKRNDRSLPFPVRMMNGAPGKRSCTADFKIRVIAKELKRRGATAENPAAVGLGISVDEMQRARTPGVPDPRNPEQVRYYPLIDLNLRRSDCQRIIQEAGLPLPQRSACWFCPFHSLDEWRRLKRTHPDLFREACELEAMLNRRRDALGKDHVWLTRFARPLSEVVDDQLVFDGTDLDNCESGYCLT